MEIAVFILLTLFSLVYIHRIQLPSCLDRAKKDRSDIVNTKQSLHYGFLARKMLTFFSERCKNTLSVIVVSTKKIIIEKQGREKD